MKPDGTLVVGLGPLDVRDGTAEALVAVRPDGSLDLSVEGSLADAAATMAKRLPGPVRCEERLAFVGRRHGWQPRPLTGDELTFRASLALSIAARWPPTWQDEARRLITAWRSFWPLSLWNELPAAMALPLVRTRGSRSTHPAISILGQSGQEFGAALYDSAEDFHSLFGQGLMRGESRAVLAQPGALAIAFDPLGVPCPMVVTVKGLRSRPPARDDVRLLAGGLELLAGILEAQTETALGPGDVLAFEGTPPAGAPLGAEPSFHSRQEAHPGPWPPVAGQGVGVKRLTNTIQPYAWGSRTALAELCNVPPSGEPQAELWLGAHPLAPSRLDGRPLDAVIAEQPEAMLGPASVARFGPRLPFLLKVLAAERPLSLQAHPSRDQARAGFARENAAGVPLTAPHRVWKDDNHKPELLCALTPFRALCGFREPVASRALLAGLAVPGLAPLLSALESGGLRLLFVNLMTLPKDVAAALVADVANACRQRPVPGFEAECTTAAALHEAYPGDAGVVAALLLHLVQLAPGEALALGAGNLHAYLGGVGVEVMANSDNVLRGGLTPKHVDVPALLEVLDFSSGPPPLVRPSGTPEAVYDTPFPDFRLSRLTVREPMRLSRLGADVLLCTEGAVAVGGVMLERGQSGFCAFAEGPLELSGTGTVFRATVNA